MKISFDNGKTWVGESQGAVSPENAAKKLRNRISETLHRGLGIEAYQARRLAGMEVNQDLHILGNYGICNSHNLLAGCPAKRNSG